MENFQTGYNFIDETTKEIKSLLSEEDQKRLNYILTKIYSLGVHVGYSQIKQEQTRTTEIPSN